MRTKVSVIVPIYNVEQYLSKCIESICAQTLKEIEIILINDGSTDKSGEIADNYSKEDNRIKVIHKENGGLSDARNVGMEFASGEYIAFADSDDWIEPNTLEDMYNNAISNDSDVVISGKSVEYVNEKYTIEDLPGSTITAKSSNEIKEAVFLLCQKGLFNVVWNKLYRKKILCDNNCKFILDAMPAEDIIFNSIVFCNITSISIINQAYYHYMKRDIASYVTKYSSKIYEVGFNRYNSFKSLFDSNKLNDNIHMEWLDRVYVNNLIDCVVNMYRRGSTLTFMNRKYFIQEKVLGDSYLKDIICKYQPENIYQKIFKNLYMIDSPLCMLLIYDFLFFMRRNFNQIYLKFRRRMKGA